MLRWLLGRRLRRRRRGTRRQREGPGRAGAGKRRLRVRVRVRVRGLGAVWQVEQVRQVWCLQGRGSRRKEGRAGAPRVVRVVQVQQGKRGQVETVKREHLERGRQRWREGQGKRPLRRQVWRVCRLQRGRRLAPKEGAGGYGVLGRGGCRVRSCQAVQRVRTSGYWGEMRRSVTSRLGSIRTSFVVKLFTVTVVLGWGREGGR